MESKKLTIVAKIIAKSEKSEFVKQELIKLIEPTRAEEGCIDYVLHQDNENENTFLFFENWASRELWQVHMNTTHIAEFKKAVDGAIEKLIINEMSEVN